MTKDKEKMMERSLNVELICEALECYAKELSMLSSGRREADSLAMRRKADQCTAEILIVRQCAAEREISA